MNRMTRRLSVAAASTFAATGLALAAGSGVAFATDCTSHTSGPTTVHTTTTTTVHTHVQKVTDVYHTDTYTHSHSVTYPGHTTHHCTTSCVPHPQPHPCSTSCTPAPRPCDHECGTGSTGWHAPHTTQGGVVAVPHGCGPCGDHDGGLVAGLQHNAALTQFGLVNLGV